MAESPVSETSSAGIDLDLSRAVLRITGAWTSAAIGEVEQRLQALDLPAESELRIDGAAVTAMDTSGAWLLDRTIVRLATLGCRVQLQGLRPEAETLLKLITACRAGVTVSRPGIPGVLASVGLRTQRALLDAIGFLGFVGESTLALMRSLAQPTRVRWRAILYNIQSAGFAALPITGLLSLLMGLVIAYQGADQLQLFGANIFVADLVGISMLRELSPLLTAIIVAGRSGSAYTAQIGTMKVTEEIDALRTIGVSPQDLLVLPKLIALVVVLPLLTVYTDVAGVLGGMIMAQAKLGVSFEAFINRLEDAITLSTYLVGVGKAPVFAVIIALVGCYRGFQVTGGADSVGQQTTFSVVQSIFLVIVADALFSIIFTVLDL